MIRKQKIILWVTVILIVIFLGLETGGEHKPGSRKYLGSPYTFFYGINLGSFYTPFAHYKYQLIVATLLIGLALFMTVKKG
ncbi:MAG: hypothetical protein ACYSSI_10345 [Planctomycetota bacterium]|jgi:hypothetical protein